MLVLGFGVTACDDNSAGEEETTIPTVQANNQGTSNGNQVVISEINAPAQGWIVVHRSNSSNDGPQVPEIIGKTAVEEGINTNVSIQLEEGVANDEILWAMLHEDTGTIGEYEFDGESGLDLPVTFNGNIIMTSFEIMQTNPMVSAADQVNAGNTFTVSVDAAEDGWIVIHGPNANNDGPQIPEIIGKAPVSAGSNGEVTIMLDEGESVSAGDNLFPMLHYDTGTIGEYEFDGNSGLDQPVFFEGNIVLTSFQVQANTSTLTAMDQMVKENAIMVDVDSNTEGWVVVHRSNATNDGPQVPEIIGKAPIEAGMNTGVEITFDEGVVVEDGEKLWPMVHFDTGTKGEYEFDGQNGFDLPVITADGILMTSIMVQGAATPSVVANMQPVDNNMLTIAEANTESIGFVVLHRDNGDNAPVVPASIGHGQVYLGQNNDLQITLDDGVSLESGAKVWAMLHIDNGTIGSYDFDGSAGSDDPPAFDDQDNIVMVQFTIE